VKSSRAVLVIAWATTGLFCAATLFVAIVIPLHAQDALTFGEWSRLIAEHWHLHYDAATPQEYGRPLFYVLQGWLWGIVGVSEISGRILSGLFSLLLLAALVLLVRDRPWGRLAAVLAALALLATPTFATHVVSGLTDLPVAALVALAGALVWGKRPGPARAAAVGVAAALAMLAKPSALLALLGLALAQLLLPEAWRARLIYRITPILAGIGAALVYDSLEARRAGQGLREFLQAGVDTDYYRALAAEAREYALLDGNWFGDGLRVAAFFAFAYALLRISRVGHRLAAGIALPLALVASWLGPWLAEPDADVTVGALHSAGAAAAAVGTAAFLGLGLLSDGEGVAGRAELARLLIWAVPTFAAWALYGAYDQRLLAPAWPPLLALVVLAALPAAVALALRAPPALAAATALLAVLVAFNVSNVDGLRETGWDEIRRTPARDWLDRDRMRAIVMPAFSRALVAVRPQMTPDARLLSPEGAFRFFYPGRVEQSYPGSCADLVPFRVFVLTTDEGTRRYMEDFLNVSAEPSFWAACSAPRLTQLTDGSEGYAVFRVES
jgi:4-amino-4-deoxy-L-arabinose transferase-like glycosyltransferase